AGMIDQSLTDVSPRSSDEIEDAVRKTGFLTYLRHAYCGERRRRGGLENERVACSECGRDFARFQQKRGVARSDQSDDSQRFAQSVGKKVSANGYSIALNLSRRTCEISEAVG